MKVLIDTCVVVDILQKREPFYQAAMELLLSVSNRKCPGILTAKSITDIYYLLRRSIRSEEEVRKFVRILFTLFDVKDTFSTDCELALNSPHEVLRRRHYGTDCFPHRRGLHRDQKFKVLQAGVSSCFFTRAVFIGTCKRGKHRRTKSLGFLYHIRLQTLLISV